MSTETRSHADTDSTAARFAARAGRFADVVEGASPHWDTPTPCPEWTVRDVVRHAVETERAFFDQRDLPLPEQAFDDLDPVATWSAHTAAVVEVLGREGVAEREYDGYFGRTTIAATVADFYGWDLVIHGWDVARATGQDYPIDDDEAAALSATADTWGPALYSEGVCAAAVEVPADASPGDRLLARLGRDPAWTP